MTFHKTRIWHGGLRELGLPEAQPTPPEPAPEAAPEAASGVSAEQATVFEQQASELVPTRFFPIDSLYAPQAPSSPPQAHVQTEPTIPLARLAAARVGVVMARLRRLPRGNAAAYGLLACAAALVLLWPVDPVPSARTRGAHTPSAPQRVVEAERPAPTRQAALVAAPQGLERAAVDALVAGDFATALTRYAQLAAARPDHPGFVEAERILTLRLQTAP